MVATGLALELVSPSFLAFEHRAEAFFFFQPLPSIEASLWSGLIAFAGAYVAGVRFVIPAIAFFCITTALAFHLLVSIAEPFQSISYFEVAARNSLGSILGLIVFVLAAELGTVLSTSRTASLEAA